MLNYTQLLIPTSPDHVLGSSAEPVSSYTLNHRFTLFFRMCMHQHNYLTVYKVLKYKLKNTNTKQTKNRNKLNVM